MGFEVKNKWVIDEFNKLKIRYNWFAEQNTMEITYD